MNTRINEYGVEMAVCCDTDMDLQIIHLKKHWRGWDEYWCCKVCHKMEVTA
tara:strand:+ start:270 stop:422 length:153 start_codon:yes stop_codon:yes gene_type:complete